MSVLMAVHQYGGMAAAALEIIRPYADEIVVAFDSRIPRNQLGPIEPAADVVLGFEFSGPNRFRPWLREQARGDWLLLLDSDEFPSEAFLAALPAMLEDRHVSGYLVPIWWVYPNPHARLTSAPWAGAGHLRLVRNDGRLWFPGTKHTGAMCDAPTRFVDAPLLHMALLAETRAQREDKVERYDQQASLYCLDGRPINDAYYLPERRHALLAGHVGPRDARNIQTALDRRWETREPSRTYDITTAAEVERWWLARPVPDLDCRADITVLGEPPTILAGASVKLDLGVSNRGQSVWPATALSRGGPVVHVSYHWKSPDGATVVREGRRTALPARVLPGDTVRLSVDIDAPATSGAYVLSLDLVHEGVRWFESEHDLAIQVQPGIRAQLGLGEAQVMVSVENATAARRRLLQPDGLAHALSAEGQAGELQPPIDLPVGGWALDAAVLNFLLGLIRREGYRRVLEFGSGTSTVVLAREMASCGGLVLSVEEDAAYAQETSRRLAGRGFAPCARTVVAPLASTNTGGTTTRCYDFSPNLSQQIRDFAPDLIVIDGPSPLGSRLAVALSVDRLVDRPTPFVMDDALRDRGLDVAAKWEAAPGIHVDGVAVIGKGLLIGRVGMRQEAELNVAGFVGHGLPGAYTFYSDPRAIAVGGRALVGAVNSDGTVHAGWFRPAGCEVSALHHQLERDDHASPAFLLRRSDGRILAFYGRHVGPLGTAGSDCTYVRISTHPGDPRSWDPAINIGHQLRAGHFGYANPVQLSGEPREPIYNFFRCATDADGTCLHFSRSDDGGLTWTAATKLARSATPHKDSRPYFRVTQNGDDRIDICLTDGHPNECATNSVYHFYYQAGHWLASDGTDLGAPPFTVADHLTRVFDGATALGKAWVWSIEVDGDGHPVIAYAAFPAHSDHRYRFARWNGAEWIDREIAVSGDSIYSEEAYYSGGICLDPEDVRVVFFSRKVDGIFQLFKATTPDDGASWAETQITQGTRHCLRPYVVRDLRTLCYLCGTYQSYTRFDVEVALLDIEDARRAADGAQRGRQDAARPRRSPIASMVAATSWMRWNRPLWSNGTKK